MNKRIPIIIGLLLLLFAVWIQVSNIGFLQRYITRLESLAYDVQLRTKLLTHPSSYKKTSVAIIDIDDKTLDREGRWPWPRAKLAELITRAQEAGAVVIALDILLSEKEENIVETVLSVLNQNKLLSTDLEASLKKIQPSFDNDAVLAKVLKQSDTELAISFLPTATSENQLQPPLISLTNPAEKALDFIIASGYISSLPLFQNAAKTAGFINIFGDEDGIIRSVPLLIRYGDGLYPSLALEAVRLYLLGNVKLITAYYGKNLRLEGVNIENHLIPTDSKARVIIPFQGKSFTFPYISATDLLHKNVPPDALLGKIVFIGTSATGLGDLQATSISTAFPGVEIQATIADGILNNTFSYRPAWSQGAEIFLTIVLGIFMAWGFPYLGPRSLTGCIILIPALLIYANTWLWDKTGLIISIFIPIVLTVVLAFVNMIYGYLFETRRREHLKEMFGQYVPEKHIDEMLTTSSGSYGMYGEDRDMSVLFADIRNFTTISEGLSATQLKEVLNDFFTPMTEIIFKYSGTIDKYVGDLIMAFWGAPLKDKRHAQHAISAALDMQQKVKELQPILSQKHNLPEIRIGIGINSGTMSVGDMGSKFRRNYTVLGDAVNLGSRVEGLNKYYGTKIIVTEFTKKQIKNVVFRQLDRVRVRGKQKGINLFEVICRKSDATDAIEQEVELSTLALNYYFNKEWQKAKDSFSQLHTIYPDVKLYEIYLGRIAEFEKTPPPENWDGVFTHVEK